MNYELSRFSKGTRYFYKNRISLFIINAIIRDLFYIEIFIIKLKFAYNILFNEQYLKQCNINLYLHDLKSYSCLNNVFKNIIYSCYIAIIIYL